MSFPTNAGQLMSGEYQGKEEFFLLCQVAQGDAVTVTVEPDFPVCVNKAEIRDQILAETGTKLPTRAEFSRRELPEDLTSKVNWDTMYTAATGPALWIRDAADENKLYLTQNDATKPVNPNRFNFPSNLVTTGLFAQAFKAMNGETRILIPDDEGNVVALNFEFPQGYPSVSDSFKEAVLANRKAQETNIQRELRKRHPEHAGKPIQWVSVPTAPTQDGAQDVVFQLPGQEPLCTKAHILADDNVHSVNVHFPLQAGVSKIGTGFAMAVDPEKYGRNHFLMTLEEAKKVDTIPAPRDYLNRALG